MNICISICSGSKPHKDSNRRPLSEFSWKVRSGGFAGKNNVPFFDFFHFNSQPVYLMLDDYNDAFMLPAYYSLSSPEFYGENSSKIYHTLPAS